MEHQLMRHGARWPLPGGKRWIDGAVSKLKAVKEFADPALEFVRDYPIDLEIDALLPAGAQESVLAARVDHGS